MKRMFLGGHHSIQDIHPSIHLTTSGGGEAVLSCQTRIPNELVLYLILAALLAPGQHCQRKHVRTTQSQNKLGNNIVTHPISQQTGVAEFKSRSFEHKQTIYHLDPQFSHISQLSKMKFFGNLKLYDSMGQQTHFYPRINQSKPEAMEHRKTLRHGHYT